MRNKTLMRTCLCALTAAFLCVISPIALPFGPIPLSLSVFAILLCAALLGPLKGASATFLYLILGAVGLPVFSGGMAGFGALLGPTGGYLWSYVPACVLSGCLYRVAWRREAQRARLLWGILAGICGVAVCYLFGTIQYMIVARVTLAAALAACVVPFLIFDLCKILLVVLFADRLTRISSVRRALF